MIEEINRIKELYNFEIKYFNGQQRVSKTRKTTENYIVGKIDGIKETFDNDHWAYKVGFHFREALDIYWRTFYKRTEVFNEQKNESEFKLSPYRSCFVEGPFLNFKCGDSFYHKSGALAIQVDASSPVTFDQKNESMNEGLVIFYEYSVKNNLFQKINLEEKNKCTQIEFLEFLITGKKSFS
ncbi:MAG: hypothetical protein ACRCSK_06320 [Fusobacteriaceae bacterium]